MRKERALPGDKGAAARAAEIAAEAETGLRQQPPLRRLESTKPGAHYLGVPLFAAFERGWLFFTTSVFRRDRSALGVALLHTLAAVHI